jgi:hypothetical protein
VLAHIRGSENGRSQLLAREECRRAIGSRSYVVIISVVIIWFYIVLKGVSGIVRMGSLTPVSAMYY